MPSKGWDKIVGAIRPNRNLPDFLMVDRFGRSKSAVMYTTRDKEYLMLNFFS